MEQEFEVFNDFRYRGKLESGKWVYGAYCTKDEYDMIFQRGIGKYMIFAVQKSSICRYTGFCDSNGAEIYENDIVEVSDGDDIYLETVRYNDGEFFIGNMCMEDFEDRTNVEVVRKTNE